MTIFKFSEKITNDIRIREILLTLLTPCSHYYQYLLCWCENLATQQVEKPLGSRLRLSWAEFEWEFHPLLTQFFSWPPCSSIPFPKVEENYQQRCSPSSCLMMMRKIPPTVKCTLQATAVVYYFCIFSIFSQTFFSLLFFGITVIENNSKRLILQHCERSELRLL